MNVDLQQAQKVIFLGTFTAAGLKVSIDEERIRIDRKGKVKKFVNQVEHVTFSGNYAQRKNQPVCYITERSVFELNQHGM